MRPIVSVARVVLLLCCACGERPTPTVVDAQVKLLRMDGVDHTYPTGEPLHAAEQVWSFFEPYALP